MSEQIRKEFDPIVLRVAAFEEWISASPYERDLSRYPRNEEVSSWPGQYRDIAVQLAWEAWSEAAKSITPEDALELRLLLDSLKREIELADMKSRLSNHHSEARVSDRERELRRGVEALEVLLSGVRK